MSAPEDWPENWDEFALIDRLWRPLAKDAPEALGLMDDAAVIPSRPGFDLVVTKDALVEGVHFLSSDPMDRVARKALRVNLSDLAAKGAAPYGYFLAIAWPTAPRDRAAFALGLGEDQARFGLKLFGGDTVSTPGPLTISVTLLGWAPAGKAVLRSGARDGDALVVSGAIGDCYLGLKAVQGPLKGVSGDDLTYLAGRYRLPKPRFDIAVHALNAAVDVSDGLIADAAHIAAASGLGVEIDLDRMPVSRAGAAWLGAAGPKGRITLATGGDDYEIAGACEGKAPDGMTAIGRFTAEPGVIVRLGGAVVDVPRGGYRHGKDG